MWSSVKCSITPNNTLYIKARNGEEVKYFEHSPNSIIIVDIPATVGTPEECSEILQDIYESLNVSHCSRSIFKVVCRPNWINKNNPFEIARNHYIPNLSVSTALESLGFNYFQHLGDDGKPEESKEPLQSPKTIIWTLEEFKDTITQIRYYDGSTYNLLSLQQELVLENYERKYFENEVQLLETFLSELVKYDISITYDFEEAYTKIIHNLEKSESKQSAAELKENPLSLLSKDPLTFNAKYPVDFVDLHKFVSTAYCYFEDTQLKTVAKYLLKVIPDDPENDTLMNIKDLWQMFEPIFKSIAMICLTPYSKVGDDSNAIDVMRIYSPHLLILGSKDYKSMNHRFMTRGWYDKVYIYDMAPLYVRGLTMCQDPATIEIKEIVESLPYRWIVQEYFYHSFLSPLEITELKCGSIIGVYHDLIFSNQPIMGLTPCAIRTETSIIVASGSWISRQPDGEFLYFGISKLTRHPFEALKKALKVYLNHCIVGRRPTDDRKFVSQLQTPTTKDLYINVIQPSGKKVKCIKGKDTFYEEGVSAKTPDLQWYSNEILKAISKIPQS